MNRFKKMWLKLGKKQFSLPIIHDKNEQVSFYHRIDLSRWGIFNALTTRANAPTELKQTRRKTYSPYSHYAVCIHPKLLFFLKVVKCSIAFCFPLQLSVGEETPISQNFPVSSKTKEHWARSHFVALLYFRSLQDSQDRFTYLVFLPLFFVFIYTWFHKEGKGQLVNYLSTMIGNKKYDGLYLNIGNRFTQHKRVSDKFKAGILSMEITKVK